MIRLPLAALALAAPLLVHAQMYKWVDAKGVVHYSQTRPPDGKVEEVTPRAPPPTASPNQQSLQKFVAGSAKASADAKKSEQATASAAADRKQRCDAAKSRLAFLTRPRGAYEFIVDTNPDGTTKEWDQSRLDSETAQARKNVTEACKA